MNAKRLILSTLLHLSLFVSVALGDVYVSITEAGNNAISNYDSVTGKWNISCSVNNAAQACTIVVWSTASGAQIGNIHVDFHADQQANLSIGTKSGTFAMQSLDSTTFDTTYLNKGSLTILDLLTTGYVYSIHTHVVSSMHIGGDLTGEIRTYPAPSWASDFSIDNTVIDGNCTGNIVSASSILSLVTSGNIGASNGLSTIDVQKHIYTIEAIPKPLQP